jgi:hypothetical protein
MGVIRVEDCISFVENLEVDSLKDMTIKTLILSVLDMAQKPNIEPKINQLLTDVNAEISETEKLALEYETNEVIVKLEMLSKFKNELEQIMDKN